MKTAVRMMLLGALVLACALAGSCNDSGSSGTGTLALQLTDDPLADMNISAVWVTIDRVSVHRETADTEGEWIDVLPNAEIATPLTVDLLDLRDGAAQTLGLDQLPADHYTQIRLLLGTTRQVADPAHPFANYVVVDGVAKKLTIPSGYQSGIKLTHEFTIEAGASYTLTLDFDANRSVHLTGGPNPKYMMRPTVRAMMSEVAGAEQTGSIEGTISVLGGCVSAQGVSVMAERCADPADPKTTEVAGEALTDADGNYMIPFLNPGTYTVVAYKAEDGAAPEVALSALAGVEVEAGQATAGTDLILACYTGATYEGTVSVQPLPSDPEETVPLVSMLVEVGGRQVVAALVGAPWDGADYSFEVIRPEPLGYDFFSDIGDVN